MRKLLLSLAATTILGVGIMTSPASAMPIGPTQIDVPDLLVEVQSRKKVKRGKSIRRSATRGRRVGRGGDPNARDPSRAPNQQSLGQTSGGPRY